MMKLGKLSLGLALMLALVGCGKKQDLKNEEKNLSPSNTKVEKAKDTNEEDLGKVEKITEEEDDFENSSERQKLSTLMSESDYISLVELSTTADNQLELRILTNFKGNLSNVEFDYPKNLSPNKQYLIFYHDDEEGNISLTRGKSSLIEISGSDDKNLQIVQKNYTTSQEDSTEKSSDSSQSKSSKSTSSKTSSKEKTSGDKSSSDNN